ncbi:MAG: hypothetical protein U0930_15640 [Pirellulales bacterium]
MDSEVLDGVEFTARTSAHPQISTCFMTQPDEFSIQGSQTPVRPQPVLVLLLIVITLVSSLPIVGVEVTLWAQPSLVGFYLGWDVPGRF